MDKMKMDSIFSFQQSQTRTHCFKYHRETSRHKYRANFIFYRSANFWNSLPNQLVNTETVNDFKGGVYCWMSSNQAKRLS